MTPAPIAHYVVKLMRDPRKPPIYWWIIYAHYQSGKRIEVLQSLRTYTQYESARRAALRFLTDMRGGTLPWRGEC